MPGMICMCQCGYLRKETLIVQSCAINICFPPNLAEASSGDSDIMMRSLWQSGAAFPGTTTLQRFQKQSQAVDSTCCCSLYPKTLKLHIVSHLTNADEAKNGKTTAPLNNWIQLGNVTRTHIDREREIYIYIHYNVLLAEL